MAILSVLETKKIVSEFISKNNRNLTSKKYDVEEVVRREGDQDQTIYIIKNGVFRIGKIDDSKKTKTLTFSFKSDILVPISSQISNFPSLLQIKSIENNLTKHNELYEISMEQWNDFVKKDTNLADVAVSVAYNNLNNFLIFYMKLSQNRKTKDIFNQHYDAKNPILNSGIPNKYLVEYFKTTPTTLMNLFLDKKIEFSKEK
jgi:hypothetical protein